MAVTLANVVPFGRSRREYELMFNLTPDDGQKWILGCGDGPASFNAEMTRTGSRVTSIDPIYCFSGEQIAHQFHAVVEDVIAQVKQTPQDWVWSYHRDPEDLKRNRIQALHTFLADYELGKQEERYVEAALPELPFCEQAFDLALCSHFLFLYSNQFSYEFHLRSVLELCRVADEVRIFPLLALDRQVSPFLDPLRQDLHRQGIESEQVQVEYELQKGGNQMLRLCPLECP